MLRQPGLMRMSPGSTVSSHLFVRPEPSERNDSQLMVPPASASRTTEQTASSQTSGRALSVADVIASLRACCDLGQTIAWIAHNFFTAKETTQTVSTWTDADINNINNFIASMCTSSRLPYDLDISHICGSIQERRTAD